MAKKSITGAITAGPEGAQMAHQAAHETLALLPTYQSRVAALVVESAEDYLLADTLLGQLHDLRKGWGGIYRRLEEKVIKPLRSVLEEVYKVNRDVDRPLEALESRLKAKMADYKRREMAAAQAVKQAEEDAERHLREQAEAAQRKAEAAKTPQMRGRLEQAAEDFLEKAQQLAQQSLEDTPLPVEGSNSGLRQKTRPRVTNLALFLVGIIEQTIPESCLLIHERELERQWKQDPEGVASWPGVTVSADVSVVNK